MPPQTFAKKNIAGQYQLFIYLLATPPKVTTDAPGKPPIAPPIAPVTIAVVKPAQVKFVLSNEYAAPLRITPPTAPTKPKAPSVSFISVRDNAATCIGPASCSNICCMSAAPNCVAATLEDSFAKAGATRLADSAVAMTVDFNSFIFNSLKNNTTLGRSKCNMARVSECTQPVETQVGPVAT